jgi:two-component system sensor histidine kinase KdpD
VLRARRRLRPESRRLAAALLGLAGLLLDRRAAAAVAERARALEASDRLKAAVLSSVSHELKSPIASLRAGLTTLLMPEAALPAEHRDLVAGLDHQATRLDRLVGDLLTMSRLEAGLPPELSAQDLGEVVGAVLGSLQPALAGLAVRTELEPDLPPVLADEQQVQRVITNLLENAAEWTPAGGGIAIGARARDACVEAWVANEGPPIPAADLDRIFEKFWTRRRGGSGLGLAICRLIVEVHGGVIRAENTPRGPRFVFELPLAERPAEAAGAL